MTAPAALRVTGGDAPLRLRHPIHRGSVLASGLALDLLHLDETTARRRILELSPHLHEVVRAGDVLIALLRTPLRLQCSAAAGAPLLRQGQLWTAAPLGPDELAALPAGQAAVVLSVGGCARVIALDELPREDLASWLDLSELECRFELEELGEPAAAAPRPVLVEVQVEARRALGVAPLTGEGQGLLRSLLARSAGDGAAPAERGGPDGGEGWEHREVEAYSRPWYAPLARLWSALGGLLPRRGMAPALPAPPAFASSPAGRALVPPRPPRRSWLARAVSALGSLSARGLMRTRLRRLIGRRYARYLERVFEMFDGNQLDEALRHAIPLGGDVEEALRQLSLSLPAPRQSLAVQPAARPGHSGLDFGAGVYEALRARYRRAFERLRDQGDFEKAAFVLAELLHADEEAVSFLEQHGKLQLAAELAEARHLSAGLVIRQWFLARDRARALRLARRSGAFGDAVSRLAASHPDEALSLRLLWADDLADSGAYSAAIDVVWPVQEARRVAEVWLDRAIEIGGVTSARMLVRKVRLLPASFAPVRERVLALLAEEELELHVLEALAAELLAEDATAEVRVLMRVVARRLLRELAAPERRGGGGAALPAAGSREPGGGAKTSSLVGRLLELCGDPALRIDATPILATKKVAAAGAAPSAFDAEEDTARRVRVPLALRPQPLLFTWEAAERGALAIRDVAELPDGKLLVALGELGAWLLSRDGRVLARFTEPAHRLVPSDHGDRAILVAPRGEVMRLSRVDLIARRASHWCDAQIDRFADEYDGALWMVSRRDTVYAVEVTAAGWQHAWKVDEPGATVVDLRREPQSLAVWFSRTTLAPRVVRASAYAGRTSARAAITHLDVEASGELWRYELPSLTLRRRAAMPLAGAHPDAGAVSAQGAVVTWLARGEDELAAEVLVRDTWHRLPLRYAPATSTVLCADAQWAVAAEPLTAPGHPGSAPASAPPIAPPASDHPEGITIHLFDLAAIRCRVQLQLLGAGRAAGVRLQHQRLLVFDDLGRLLVLSLHTGDVIRRLCVS